MFKKIVALVSTAFIICLVIVPIVSAAEYIYSPDTDGQEMYLIYPDESMNPLYYYQIYGYNSQNIGQIQGANPMATTYFGDLTEISDGTYEYLLFSTTGLVHQSALRLTVISNGTQYKLEYVVRNLTNNTEFTYFITPITSTQNDVCIYADASGELFTYYFNTNNFNPVTITGYSNQPLKCYFYGDIYMSGYGPSEITTEDLTNAYNRGKADGETIGYANGVNDATPTDSDIQAIYDRGYNDGHQSGYASGLTEGARLDNESVYNLGLANGQEQAQLIPQAVSGFFESTIEFFQPFLSIGFGQLTLFNLLGVMVIVALVVIIVKIVRG